MMNFRILLLCLIALPALAQNPEWSKEYKPFRIVGNVYYVGTYDLACYLITTSQGNILINTGLASSADVIKKNIEELGFKFADTKILLTTQGHYDHVAAMASIKKSTGAKLMVHEKDAPVVSDGGKSEYAFSGDEIKFEPASVDRSLKNGDVIELGNMKLTILHHPGHTKGSASYIFDVKDESKTYKVAIVNMPTIVISKPLGEVTEYPDIKKDYARTLAALKKLKFDLWLSSHASQFNMHTKRKPGDPYNPSAFIDQAGYEKSVNDLYDSFVKHQ